MQKVPGFFHLAAVLLLCAFPSAVAYVTDQTVPESSPHNLLTQGKVDEAIEVLHTSLRKAPTDAESHFLLCRAHYDFRDFSPAVQSCEKAVSLQPNSATYHLWLGRAYGEKADESNFLIAAPLASKVKTEFETAVSLDPKHIEAHTDLAEFYLEAPGIVGGSRDKALAQASILDTLDPGRAHWVRARIAQKAKDMATAETEYKAAVAASKGSALQWLNLALFYRKQSRFNEMEDALHHAASASHEEREILMESAETLIRSDRDLPLAIQWLRAYLDGPMVELAPAFKARYWLGVALEKQGDKRAAAEQYQSALNLARGYSLAQKALQQLNSSASLQ
jgi:cytochrome c-type biogenesis protein CcmH/NrfG